MENLKGPFKDIIPLLIIAKKSNGYKYNNIYNYITIDNILYENGIFDFKDSKKIYNILITNETSKSKRKRNYSSLKEIYKFMNTLGYSNLYLEKVFFKRKNKFSSIILTENEIKFFFKTIDELNNKLSKNYKDIYPVMFRLIYSCGLRISECLYLKKTNFNISTGTIIIENSKNGITRTLPLSDSMFNVMKLYYNKKAITNKIYLFEFNSKQCPYNTVRKFFKEAINICNINNKMRVHDLRWNFANNAFNKLYYETKNGDYSLDMLSKYMGHSGRLSTEYYLCYNNYSFDKLIKLPRKKIKQIFSNIGDNHE